MSFFGDVGAKLAHVAQKQTDLQRAVASGELWMEAGVADAAAKRCDRTRDEINQWLSEAEQLAELRKFGDNEDGVRAAERYAQAGREVMAVMKDARTVFENMAATYRAAGGLVAITDEANAQMLRSQPE